MKKAGPEAQKKGRLSMNFIHHQSIEAKPPMNGKALARASRKASPAKRAIMAAPLTNGATIGGLTKAQAARLAGVSVKSVAIVGGASEDQIKDLWRGRVSLNAVRKAKPSRAT
jgi:hypothetical protein